MTDLVWILAGYLVGALPASYVAGRLAGVDLRRRGSGNLGATNVYRVLGWRYAVPVALFDVAKGAAPVLLARGAAADSAWLPLAVGVAAVLGHVFPVYVRFRGGKGVATAAGVVVALAPLAAAASAVVWLSVLGLTRFVSLASMLGAAAFPVAVVLLGRGNRYVLAMGVILAGFIVYTHRENIRRLLAGTEHRFGQPAARTAGGP